MQSLPITHTVTERFLRYVTIDTQSDPTSDTCPSTEKQKDLGRVLVAELQAMGITDAHMDMHGYVLRGQSLQIPTKQSQLSATARIWTLRQIVAEQM